ncbi:methylmalonyl-CoA epimerase [Pontibacter ummariensis]|uniref:Lactoylglutathione lyase n=1 Tax=Pontibacter ummariensis TaxID=1610492 RepID=A0A239ET05_9BACT|nr:VOC family protein [Pontibacter ummariensis]PRY12794.1 methylmalonyl-CoA epimerase [Pontibacter ummariensis]SNS46994.1 lactoylglutathione lyase [Pontibacter ummariensis]
MNPVSATINHIALYVHDLNRSVKFYEEVLQLRQIPEPFKDGWHFWFSMGGRSQLHLIEGAPKEIPQEKNTHICFSVASLEEFMANLDALDIPYGNFAGELKTPNLRSDGIRQIFFQDPDGYWLEVNDDHV